jgi:hypothetical protein
MPERKREGEGLGEYIQTVADIEREREKGDDTMSQIKR